MNEHHPQPEAADDVQGFYHATTGIAIMLYRLIGPGLAPLIVTVPEYEYAGATEKPVQPQR